MLFKTLSASVYGIDAYLVEVEVDVGSARMTDFNVVGLPDNAVKESQERIKSALRNCGSEFPHGQGVTINLAPADVRKEGSAFDLPMALGLTGCMGQFFGKVLDNCMFLGELSLDGSVRPLRGALSAALAAREVGLKSVAVPEANAREAAVVEGVDVYGLKSLPQAVDLVNSPESFQPLRVDAHQLLSEAAQYAVDLRDVHGQQAAKRALEVACAGGHNICSSDHLGQVRPCWPSASQRFCRPCRWTRPSRRRASIASPESWKTLAAWWVRDRFARRTIPSVMPD
jgi:magnesium chelatase family protein